MPKKVEYLVVDTSAFIKNAQLQEIGENIITHECVVNEIKSKRQLRRLVVLPYDLKLKDVFSENIAFVSEFSKKTGDYRSLSATDIKIIALTYQLEKELVGTEHLKTKPEFQKTVEFTDHCLLKTDDIAGFYLPQGDARSDGNFSDEEEEAEESDEGVIKDEEEVAGRGREAEEVDKDEGVDISGENSEEDEFGGEEELCERLENMNVDREDCPLKRVQEEEVVEVEEEAEGAEGDWSHGWITPSNLEQAKRGIDPAITQQKKLTVACLSTDFAIQNVLKQIGLNVVSLDGLLINEIRTYILRCYACFKTTSIMTKVFCPSCGNKTLKKVAVTVDSQGQQHIHINLKRPLTARGKKFSLPKPQGGKHAVNPILCEDQPVPQQRLSKLARTKTNALHPDYIAGYSPFAMRDINSKSIMLGHHLKGGAKYWMRKNPNEVVKHRKKK